MGSGDSRRGQNASQAAILIALVGGLLIAYILFLPPAQREQLLFGNGNNPGYNGPGGAGGNGVVTQYGPVLIMKETPGTLRMLKSPTSEHNIPSATIYTAINTQEVKAIDSAVVKNSIFAHRPLDIQFDAVKSGSSNFLLSFNVDEAGSGSLLVYVNGHLIYQRPVRERSPAPIPIPVDYLVDGQNHIIIDTDDTGFAFWKANSYALHSILISADLIDDKSAAVQQQFSISDDEMGAFDSAELQFVPECNQKKTGRLIVQLNSKIMNNQTQPNIIYSGLPDCGVLNKLEVSQNELKTGENVLLFASPDGQYIIDRIKLIVNMHQNDYPTYYFNLPKEMYDTVQQAHGQIRLTLTFSDYRGTKAGEITINGFVQSFTSEDYTYEAVVDPGILTPGPNTLQIIPHVDRLNIAEVKVELV